MAPAALDLVRAGKTVVRAGPARQPRRRVRSWL